MDKECELRYLQKVEDVIAGRIQDAEQHLSSSAANILESKRELWRNFYELDPEEIAANTQLIENDVIQHEYNQKNLFTLYRQKDNPYFGRIDFLYPGESGPDKCYIGLSNLNEKDSTDILVFDWRAPISSMYYNYELGPASFTAPVGEIHGSIVGKYQYKISRGEMQYMFDSSVTVHDEILQLELSGNASDRMRNIVATIQKEQNTIIRTDAEKTLIVQGAAGSGKTSIALHRVAYLLYRYRNTLKSSNILIISPSKMFSNYIAGVLPELGEECIIEMSMADLAKNELGPHLKLESRLHYLDHYLSVSEIDTQRAEMVRFKSSPQFLSLMNEYASIRTGEIYQPAAISLGTLSLSEELLRGLYEKQLIRYAPVERIKRIREVVHERFSVEVGGKRLKNELYNLVEETLDSFEKYGSLISEYNRFIEYLNDHGYQAGSLVANRVPFEDVFPLLLLKSKLFGTPDNRIIKHLLIDEMQDYTPVQYEIINMMFKCPKTILGDIEQVVDSLTNIGNNVVLQNIYDGSSVYLELNTSYRSTYEISELAKCIIQSDRYKSVERHGDKPVLFFCEDTLSQSRRMAADINDLVQRGYSSIAVMCKTIEEASDIWEKLRLSADDIRLLINPDEKYNQGVIVTTCFIAKGLEFDCVLIPNCSSSNYIDQAGAKPLYVSATRALHQLYFYAGKETLSSHLTRALDKGLLQAV